MKPRSRARLGVFIFVVVLFDPCASGLAKQRDRALVAAGISPKRAEGTPRAREPRPEPRADIGAVTGAAGQAGYVHYFVITGPDGETETQVGIELADGRVVWSFPEAGVFVSPFMAWGSVTIGATRYDVEHLFGVASVPGSAVGPRAATRTPLTRRSVHQPLDAGTARKPVTLTAIA